MKALRHEGESQLRSVLLFWVWMGIGLGVVVFSGCGPSNIVPVAASPGGTGIESRHPRPGVAGTELGGTASEVAPTSPFQAITSYPHILSIESDVAGSSTATVYFELDLAVDGKNAIQFIRLQRMGTDRPALPSRIDVTPEERLEICEQNSKASQENCMLDLEQLAKTGLVIERLMGKPGVVLKADEGFSAQTGGGLTLTTADVSDAPIATAPETLKLQLQQAGGRWRLNRVPARGRGISMMRLSSRFTGLFATSIESIEIW